MTHENNENLQRLKLAVQEAYSINNYFYPTYKEHWRIVKDCFYSDDRWRTNRSIEELKQSDIKLNDFIKFFEELLEFHHIRKPKSGKSSNYKFLNFLKSEKGNSLNINWSTDKNKRTFILKKFILKWEIFTTGIPMTEEKKIKVFHDTILHPYSFATLKNKYKKVTKYLPRKN